MAEATPPGEGRGGIGRFFKRKDEGGKPPEKKGSSDPLKWRDETRKKTLNFIRDTIEDDDQAVVLQASTTISDQLIDAARTDPKNTLGVYLGEELKTPFQDPENEEMQGISSSTLKGFEEFNPAKESPEMLEYAREAVAFAVARTLTEEYTPGTRLLREIKERQERFAQDLKDGKITVEPFPEDAETPPTPAPIPATTPTGAASAPDEAAPEPATAASEPVTTEAPVVTNPAAAEATHGDESPEAGPDAQGWEVGVRENPDGTVKLETSYGGMSFSPGQFGITTTDPTELLELFENDRAKAAETGEDPKYYPQDVEAQIIGNLRKILGLSEESEAPAEDALPAEETVVHTTKPPTATIPTAGPAVAPASVEEEAEESDPWVWPRRSESSDAAEEEEPEPVVLPGSRSASSGRPAEAVADHSREAAQPELTIPEINPSELPPLPPELPFQVVLEDGNINIYQVSDEGTRSERPAYKNYKDVPQAIIDAVGKHKAGEDADLPREFKNWEHAEAFVNLVEGAKYVRDDPDSVNQQLGTLLNEANSDRYGRVQQLPENERDIFNSDTAHIMAGIFNETSLSTTPPGARDRLLHGLRYRLTVHRGRENTPGIDYLIHNLDSQPDNGVFANFMFNALSDDISFFLLSAAQNTGIPNARDLSEALRRDFPDKEAIADNYLLYRIRRMAFDRALAREREAASTSQQSAPEVRAEEQGGPTLQDLRAARSGVPATEPTAAELEPEETEEVQGPQKIVGFDAMAAREKAFPSENIGAHVTDEGEINFEGGINTSVRVTRADNATTPGGLEIPALIDKVSFAPDLSQEQQETARARIVEHNVAQAALFLAGDGDFSDLPETSLMDLDMLNAERARVGATLRTLLTQEDQGNP